jgi:hypothetical protein
MSSAAGKQCTFSLDGNSQVVVSTYGWPLDRAVAWDVHCSYSLVLSGSGGPSPAQMGMVLPPGAQSTGYGSSLAQTYYFLIQNAGGLQGEFDLCYLYITF